MLKPSKLTESLILPPKVTSRSRMMGIFDFDGTLVKPKEGRRFPKDKDDWEWLDASIPHKLKALSKEKIRLVIVTDQSKPWKVEMIQHVVEHLKLNITVIIGVKDEQKPNPSLFLRTLPNYNKETSFYIGDAAGRGTDWSDRDKKFAEAIGVTFHTPEAFFEMKPFKPKHISISIPTHPEVVVMVGYPGSGKSTFAKTMFPSDRYHYVEGDVYKTAKAMVKEAEKYSHQSIVFDATNGTKERRAPLIAFAKEKGLPIRCIWVQTSLEQSLAQVKQRELETGIKIPAVVLYVYRKKFEEPTEEECTLIKIDR